jgi:hypothetical protein
MLGQLTKFMFIILKLLVFLLQFYLTMKVKVVFTFLSLVLVIRTMGIILANPTILIDHIIINVTDAKGKIKY